MDHAETNPVKPRRRWFQFNLKTLMLLPVVVSLPLSLYLYWADWRKYRPPISIYDQTSYPAAINKFVTHLVHNRPEQAYALTSARFKEQMSLDEFRTLIGRYPTLHHGPKRTASVIDMGFAKKAALRNWIYCRFTIEGTDKKIIRLDAWVVMNDSFFYRRPPLPKIEEIQIREIWDWDIHNATPMKASWERE